MISILIFHEDGETSYNLYKQIILIKCIKMYKFKNP
jgi:hypothetical protein